VKCSASRVEASETLGPLPLRPETRGVRDVDELLRQGSAGWSANYGIYYSTRLCSSRTGWLAVRPAITEVSCGQGLFVESDYPPPT
jgi:hypothetical protein